MSKYPISKEFFPFSYFTPPISEKFLAMAVPNMTGKRMDEISLRKPRMASIRKTKKKNSTPNTMTDMIVIPHRK